MYRAFIVCLLALALMPAAAFGATVSNPSNAPASDSSVDFITRFTDREPGRLPSGDARMSLATASSSSGAGAVDAAEAGGLQVQCIEGANRIETAIAASRHAFPDGSDVVIIVAGDSWPDALSGSSLAGLMDAPILLAQREGHLSSSVRSEITRLGAQGAIIIGGESAVSTWNEQALVGMLGPDNVLRIAGGNRYETSAVIANLMFDVQAELFGDYDRISFVATGANFPDALGASPLSVATWWPIVLVNPSGMDQVSASVLARGATELPILLGGTGALPAATQARVAQVTGCQPLRLAGATRYDTALEVSSWGVNELGLSWDGLALATGANFPDALAGGSVQGRTGSVMLLTGSTGLPPAVAECLASNKADIFELHYLGGLNALNQAVRDEAERILYREPVEPPPPPPPPPPGPVNPIPGTLWQPSAALPTSGNYVYLDSDVGDYIGQGQEYLYTPADADINVTSSGGRLSVRVDGNEYWSGEFQAMNAIAQLQPGYYPGVRRYPFHDPTVGGLSWTGEGRGSNTLSGWFVVDSVTYANGALTAIDLRFEQHSESNAPALHGAIHWTATPPAPPPGPVNPIPETLWRPSASLPTTDNYVYLDSDVGDYIGQGEEYLYTPSNAVISVNAASGRLSVSVNGNESWSGEFQTMNTLTQLQTGYYPGLQRYPFHNPTAGGLDWSGEGRGSNTLTGWFVVDSVTYTDGALTAIDLRFEQHSEGATPALRGAISWKAVPPTPPTPPPGPVYPIPDTLWRPSAAAVPAAGNYVYLDSEAGDWIGQGQDHVYTPANAVISVSASGGHLDVGIDGNEWWNGDFQTMNTLSQLQPGYYPGLQRYPFHNPVVGGLNWSGEGRGSNTLTGWFIVDSVTYTNGTLTAIDLRFEQHSEGGAAALRGAIHWTANDTTQPAGPVNPIPETLWRPSASLPATGSYVYLDSEAGDWIGQGQKYLYTPANSTITVTPAGGRVSVDVSGAQRWDGEFQGMNTISQLKVGYYPGLQRYPFHNPAVGGLSWSGQGRGSNTLTGWFVVDNVTYTNGVLTAIDLRFEQHSGGATPALHGVIHWTAGS